jgi:hypothetical protein
MKDLESGLGISMKDMQGLETELSGGKTIFLHLLAQKFSTKKTRQGG